MNWGSSGEGAKYIMAYRSLRSLAATQQHVKNWRPQLLAIVGSEEAATAEEEKVDNGVIALLRDLRKGHGFKTSTLHFSISLKVELRNSLNVFKNSGTSNKNES